MGRIAARLGTDMAIRKLKPKPGQKTPVRFAVSGELVHPGNACRIQVLAPQGDDWVKTPCNQSGGSNPDSS